MNRVGHGLVRTPSGRVREMTDREIDRFADEMEAFAATVEETFEFALAHGAPETLRTFGYAVAIAEGA